MNVNPKIVALLKSLRTTIFNSKENIYHQPTDAEAALIKNTQLFAQMTQDKFNELLCSIKCVKYPAGKLIFREGERGNSLDVIIQGSVRVYTHDMNGKIIPLARLNRGDYFGEQALLGQAYRTRNANISAIDDTMVLQIDAEFLTHLLQVDAPLKIKLQHASYKQLLNILSLSTGFYNDIKSIIAQLENPQIKEFTKGEAIFHAGDAPDNVYIVLEGEVALQIPDHDKKNINNLILHRGQLFGELGVIKGAPRAATAIAHSNIRLLSIEDKKFKQYISDYPQLHSLLSTLEKLYQLPTKGSMEQHISNMDEAGSNITNIYKLEDGRSVISSTYINENIFSIYTVGAEISKEYRYKNNDTEIILDVFNNYLVAIKANGFHNDLSLLYRLLLDQKKVSDATLNQFALTGEFQFSDNTIEMPSWISAVMKRLKKHSDLVYSYLLLPQQSHFKAASAGQHVIIQVKVGDNWVERPYSISGTENGGLRITIKKDPKGLFAQWLFENAPEEIQINASQPRGNFLLDMDNNKNTLCLAGGIGITPFIMYAKSLHNLKNNKKIHIIYSALTKNDFIFMDELNQIVKETPTISITYRATDTDGMLNEQDIIHAIKENNNPEIYICGPAPFERMVKHALEMINYDMNKIHGEQFVHAGVVPPSLVEKRS